MIGFWDRISESEIKSGRSTFSVSVSPPPLRGQPTMPYFAEVGFPREIIDLFGGIRFLRTNLFEVDVTMRFPHAKMSESVPRCGATSSGVR